MESFSSDPPIIRAPTEPFRDILYAFSLGVEAEETSLEMMRFSLGRTGSVRVPRPRNMLARTGADTMRQLQHHSWRLLDNLWRWYGH